MEILRVNNLRKSYKSEHTMVEALDIKTFSVEKGDFVVITGASGSGKSTLLHMLGSVDEPTFGQIWIDGEELTAMDEKQKAKLRRQKIGIIYQFYNLIPFLNIEKNILLPISMDGKKVDENYFRNVVKAVGMEERLKHMPGELSGGQQQRAAIARAMIMKPSILLADEPTGNLDRKNSEEFMRHLHNVNEQYKQTIVLVTHDDKIASSARRKIVIEDGKIIVDEVRS